MEVMAGGGYTKQLTEYTASKTLASSNNVYQFTIYDTYGDGLCCAYGNGGYNLFVDGFIIKTGGILRKVKRPHFHLNPPVQKFMLNIRNLNMYILHMSKPRLTTPLILLNIQQKTKEINIISLFAGELSLINVGY